MTEMSETQITDTAGTTGETTGGTTGETTGGTTGETTGGTTGETTGGTTGETTGGTTGETTGGTTTTPGMYLSTEPKWNPMIAKIKPEDVAMGTRADEEPTSPPNIQLQQLVQNDHHHKQWIEQLEQKLQALEESAANKEEVKTMVSDTKAEVETMIGEKVSEAKQTLEESMTSLETKMTAKIEEEIQEATTKQTIPDTFDIDMNGALYTMRRVKAGSFIRGEETPLQIDRGGYTGNDRAVEITTQHYYLGETEVTQKFWRETLNAADNASLNTGNLRTVTFSKVGDNLPVYGVTWDQGNLFVRILSNLFEVNRESWQEIKVISLSLPSESQWEKACRAGTTTFYYCGNTPDPATVNVGKSSANDLVEVRSLDPNPWGFYNMHGNVTELAQDFYHPDNTTAPKNGTANEAESFTRAYRGGDVTEQRHGQPPYEDVYINCLASTRRNIMPSKAKSLMGFRVATNFIESIYIEQQS